MIQQEEIEIGGRIFLHTYSEEFTILQVETGIEYDEAYDVIPCPYTYEETENKKVKQEQSHE